MLLNTERAAGPEAERWLGLIAIDGPVRELRPDYTALVIVAEDLRPGPSDQATDALLAEAEAGARAVLAGRAAARPGRGDSYPGSMLPSGNVGPLRHADRRYR